MAQVNDAELPTDVWRAPVAQSTSPVRKVARSGASMAALRQAALMELSNSDHQAGGVLPANLPLGGGVVATAVRGVVSERATIQEVSERATSQEVPARTSDQPGSQENLEAKEIRLMDLQDDREDSAVFQRTRQDAIQITDILEVDPGSSSAVWIAEDDSSPIRHDVDVEDVDPPASTSSVAAVTGFDDLDAMLGTGEEEHGVFVSESGGSSSDVPVSAVEGTVSSEEGQRLRFEETSDSSGIHDGWIEDDAVPDMLRSASGLVQDQSDEPSEETLGLTWIMDEQPVGGLGLIGEKTVDQVIPPTEIDEPSALGRRDVTASNDDDIPPAESFSEPADHDDADVPNNHIDAEGAVHPPAEGAVHPPAEGADLPRVEDVVHPPAEGADLPCAEDAGDAFPSEDPVAQPEKPSDPHLYDAMRLRAALAWHRMKAMEVLQPHVSLVAVRSRVLARLSSKSWVAARQDVEEAKRAVVAAEARLTTGLPTLPIIGGFFSRKVEVEVAAANQALEDRKASRDTIARKFLGSPAGRKAVNQEMARDLRKVDPERVPDKERQAVVSAKANLTQVDEINTHLRKHPILDGEIIHIAALPKDSRFLTLAASAMRWRLK